MFKKLFKKQNNHHCQNCNDINERYFQEKRDSIKKREEFEDQLLKKYGKRKIKDLYQLDIIFIADLHNRCNFTSEEIALLQSNFDVCLLLGDNSSSSILEILKYVDSTKIYGILGNHDEFNLLNNLGIPNIHGKTIKVNGITIAGFQGSFKYKNENFPAYTQEESISLSELIESADILISHEAPWYLKDFKISHQGLKGITNYIYKNNITHNFHGHLHSYSVERLNNGCVSIGLFGIQKASYQNEKFIIENIINKK